MTVTLEELVSLCKRRGILFPDSEIYGGIAGCFDYGPVGVEIKRNLVNWWWDYFVRSRDDVFGLESSILMNPRVWVASGHVERFIDWLVECKRCHTHYRADELLEERGVKIIDYSPENLARLLRERNVRCPACGGELTEPRKFNLMMETHVGPVKDESTLTYLRPETAQAMFVNFKLYVTYARNRLPFGIAQVGKVFRNEISPRGFVFRCREFEIMEIEYFIDPEHANDCPYFKDVEKIVVKIWTKEAQKEGKEPREMSIGDAYNDGVFSNMWHAYWVGESLRWLTMIGLSIDHLRVREHLETELAHYAIQTFDVEYYFPFLGWKEIEGIANRTDYDLKRHMQFSGEKLYVPLGKGKRVIPHCIEPSWGVERTLLAVLTEAYVKTEDGRVVLKLHPRLAPYVAGVYPLLSREPFIRKAEEVYRLLKRRFSCFMDVSGSIGRRYARADEIGVPFGITIDHQTLEDDTVTIRFRDTREQIRVKISDLVSELERLIESWGGTR